MITTAEQKLINAMECVTVEVTTEELSYLIRQAKISEVLQKFTVELCERLNEALETEGKPTITVDEYILNDLYDLLKEIGN